MQKAIFTLMERCVACKSCEIACAVAHSQSGILATAQFEEPLPRSRVRITSAGAYSFASRCVHCEDAACIAACPTGAMHREAKTGVVAVDQDRCIGCWMCVVTCPFGAVTADPGTGKALKCDLCAARGAMGLGPACVDACPTGAMVYLTPYELAGMRRSATAMASVGAVEEIEESVALWRNFKGGRAI